MRIPRVAGGWHSILYTLTMGRQVGFAKLWRAMRSKNACKTCAVGMGGQSGGMVNERGHFPEVCKKSLQAMVGDMRGKLSRDFFQKYSLTQMRAMSSRELEAAGRLTEPLYLGPSATHYTPVTWDEALTKMSKDLAQHDPDKSFFYFSGRSSIEAGFLLQLFARQYGTNNIHNCSFYCHQASGVGLGESLGTGTATIELSDLDKADTVFLFGANPASNHPRLLTSLMRLRRRGGKVIVINPIRERGLERFAVPSDMRSLFLGSDIASHYIQPHAGGDIAVMTGIAKALFENVVTLDQSFIDQSTKGFEAFRALVESTSWADIVDAAGVAKAELESAAAVYRQSKCSVFAWTMGITHHVHGVDNVQWIVNLALLRGMVGREGCGLLPIRGHSNVQGMGTAGVMPQLKAHILERFEKAGIPVPTKKGLDTMASMEASHRGEITTAICLGGNLFGSNPDSAYAAKAMNQISTIAYLSTSLNTGHAWGTGRETFILPVLARNEEEEPTTQESMFSFVRLSDGNGNASGKAKASKQDTSETWSALPQSEVKIISALAKKVMNLRKAEPKDADYQKIIDWGLLANHGHLRSLIADLVPDLEQLRHIGDSKKEFAIANRILHQPTFATPDGKARFKAIALPAQLPKEAPHKADKLETETLRLMTLRSEGQFNTVVYEDHDVFRGQERRDVVLMNEEDMRQRGLSLDDSVRVESKVGMSLPLKVRPFAIRAGNIAMYYPEANILVPRNVDPRSGTPAFKHIPVTLKKIASTPQRT